MSFGPYRLVGIAEMKSHPYCLRYAWHSLMPAILAIAYHSLVGSSGPVSSCSSVIGCVGIAGIDARRTQVQQLRRVELVSRVHHGAVDHHVVVDELRRSRAVGHDSADRASDEEHVLGPVRLEPVRHLGLIAQVELVLGPQ